VTLDVHGKVDADIASAMKLLIVEDEPVAAGLLAKGRREQAYVVDVAADGASASNRQ
jgi:DNA-binding response OmpR family regulator